MDNEQLFKFTNYNNYINDRKNKQLEILSKKANEKIINDMSKNNIFNMSINDIFNNMILSLYNVYEDCISENIFSIDRYNYSTKIENFIDILYRNNRILYIGIFLIIISIFLMIFF